MPGASVRLDTKLMIRLTRFNMLSVPDFIDEDEICTDRTRLRIRRPIRVGSDTSSALRE